MKILDSLEGALSLVDIEYDAKQLAEQLKFPLNDDEARQLKAVRDLIIQYGGQHQQDRPLCEPFGALIPLNDDEARAPKVHLDGHSAICRVRSWRSAPAPCRRFAMPVETEAASHRLAAW